MSSTIATPTRSLNLSGASNFRDLGGYAGLDGRTVAWGRVYRSDHLALLTPADLERLDGLRPSGARYAEGSFMARLAATRP